MYLIYMFFRSFIAGGRAQEKPGRRGHQRGRGPGHHQAPYEANKMQYIDKYIKNK
jgi:hypothetical protein